MLSGLQLQNVLLTVVGETRASPGAPLSSRVWLSLGKKSALWLLPAPVWLLACLGWMTTRLGQAWGAPHSCMAVLGDMGTNRGIVPLEPPPQDIWPQ